MYSLPDISTSPVPSMLRFSANNYSIFPAPPLRSGVASDHPSTTRPTRRYLIITTGSPLTGDSFHRVPSPISRWSAELEANIPSTMAAILSHHSSSLPPHQHLYYL
ncbi:hypothetical protein L2E82_39593 [Cichorium intybus]|uniref:Uncharacterized protein n=1 Tax=Cichorium intybus TaxID=13427 RepID=A0ACB9AJZ9_CICIN|nr:hypothetical protein L2E82_39593 [Cichorium intybus]